ncbi:MAG: response regulator transcription factor [Betaproteobacteria bacterium]|nr:MAG: response regulator transcription factor [Betaproteobacteria bacterium]
MALDTVSPSPGAARQANVQAPRAESGVMPRVLVAHANKSMRQLIKLYLVCSGYDVTLAEDAIEAGRQAMQQPPDLIILDVEMPYMDGLEFVSALRSGTSVPLIPVSFPPSCCSTPCRAACGRAAKRACVRAFAPRPWQPRPSRAFPLSRAARPARCGSVTMFDPRAAPPA